MKLSRGASSGCGSQNDLSCGAPSHVDHKIELSPQILQKDGKSTQSKTQVGLRKRDLHVLETSNLKLKSVILCLLT